MSGTVSSARQLAAPSSPPISASAPPHAFAAAVPVEVVNGTADRLPLTDGSVDALVTSLMLYSVPDQAVALAEAFRVLRPGGELRFYEHVAAEPDSRLDRVQRIADATVWSWFSGGCHVHRDTATAITSAGFTITDLDRFSFGPNPASPHILGRAIRPA